MLAVAVDLLADRYTATCFNDRNEAEWPPHPARLFSAMVAAWADMEKPSDDEADVMRWLERQAAPHVACADEASIRRRAVVTHFVPSNADGAFTDDGSSRWAALTAAEATVRAAEAGGDARVVRKAAAALAKAEKRVGAVTPSSPVAAAALRVFPENRDRRGRTYPTVVPDTPTVWFTWVDAEPSGVQIAILDGLLGRVGRLGHSSSLVSCRVTDDPPPARLVPGDGLVDPVKLRVPRRGSLAALRDGFAVHRGHDPRTLPSGTATYGWRGIRLPVARRPILAGDWYVLALPSGVRLGLTRSLDITRAVRGALLTHGPQPAPSILTGHRDGPAPTSPLAGPHVAIAPLAAVGHAQADAAVRAVAVILPCDADEEGRAAVESAVARWRRDADLVLTIAGHHGSPWRLEDRGRQRGGWVPPAETLPASQRRGTWTRPASRWATVTPIALDRFPGPLGSSVPAARDRAEADAVATITSACAHIGLPAPVNVQIRFEGPIVGVPAVGSTTSARDPRRFPAYRTGRLRTSRVCVHAVISFAEPVGGPVLLGAGRYLGYGLCFPLDGSA